MKKSILVFIVVALTSCSRKYKSDKDFVDNLVDLTIETSSGEYVQLPDLYDSLANKIPGDNDEKIFLVERLKRKGFKITNWGRGNLPPLGPRIINVELMKGRCICEVTKAYYATTVDTLYQMTEGLKCRTLIVDKN